MNLPAHICLAVAVQTIIGSACLIQDVALALAIKEDFSKYLVVAWVLHPDLIPNEVSCVVPEPKPPSDVGQRRLFLRASKIMHTKRDTLWRCVFIKVMEVHDFNQPDGDSSGDSGSDLSNADIDSVPRFSSAASSLRPWPQIYHFMGPVDPSREPWPSLPHYGGRVVWPSSSSSVSYDLAAFGSRCIRQRRMGRLVKRRV
jgi:hypothetical protein